MYLSLLLFVCDIDILYYCIKPIELYINQTYKSLFNPVANNISSVIINKFNDNGNNSRGISDDINISNPLTSNSNLGY